MPLGTSAVCPSPSRAAPALSPERRLGTTFAPRRRWTMRRPPAGGSAVQCPGGRPRRQAQAGSPPPPVPRSHTRPNGSPCSPGDASPLGPLQSSTPCGQRTRGALRRGGWPGRARPRSSSTSAEKARDAGKAAGERRPSGPTVKEGPAEASFGCEAFRLARSFPRRMPAARSTQDQRGRTPRPADASPRRAKRLRGNATGSRLRAPRFHPSLPLSPPPSWALSPTASFDEVRHPAPDYLGTETLTLQEERPFHHGPVHGPRRFLPRFLALRAGGGAGRGGGGAWPTPGVPAPPPDPADRHGGGRRDARKGGVPQIS